MTAIEEKGFGWFRTLGPLFIGGETTFHFGGMTKTEWRIGLNLGNRSFEWQWVMRRYSDTG